YQTWTPRARIFTAAPPGAAAPRAGSGAMPAISRATRGSAIALPALLEAAPQPDRRPVHRDEESEQHQNRSRGLLHECALWAVRPQVDLDRERRRRIADAVRDVDDERHHADHQERRRLAQRARHSDD